MIGHAYFRSGGKALPELVAVERFGGRGGGVVRSGELRAARQESHERLIGAARRAEDDRLGRERPSWRALRRVDRFLGGRGERPTPPPDQPARPSCAPAAPALRSGAANREQRNRRRQTQVYAETTQDIFSCDLPLNVATRFARGLLFPAAILGIPRPSRRIDHAWSSGYSGVNDSFRRSSQAGRGALSRSPWPDGGCRPAAEPVTDARAIKALLTRVVSEFELAAL